MKQLVHSDACLPRRDHIIEKAMGVIGRAIAVVIMVLILGFNAPVSRAQVTGNDLWSLHQESRPQFDMYVIGFFNGMTAAGNPADLAFIPKGVTGRQIADIVAKYPEKNPEKRHLDDTTIILGAIGEAFVPVKK